MSLSPPSGTDRAPALDGAELPTRSAPVPRTRRQPRPASYHGDVPTATVRPAGTALTVLALARVVPAVAATVLVGWMISLGLAPNAGLEGVFSVVGGILAVPVLAYDGFTVQSLIALARHRARARTLTVALSVVDIVVGLMCVVALSRAGVPMRSPLLAGLAPLVLGVLTLTVARRHWAFGDTAASHHS